MTLRQTARTALLGTAVTFALAGSAFAEGCDKIIFSDVGWTDITATTAATSLSSSTGSVLRMGSVVVLAVIESRTVV